MVGSAICLVLAPGGFSASSRVFAYLRLSLCLSLCLRAGVSLSLSSVSQSLCLFPCFSLFLSLSDFLFLCPFWSLYLCFSVSSASLALCLGVSVPFSSGESLLLRDRATNQRTQPCRRPQSPPISFFLLGFWELFLFPCFTLENARFFVFGSCPREHSACHQHLPLAGTVQRPGNTGSGDPQTSVVCSCHVC